ncbi:transposable element Tc3 transposase [Trichonephila clavipes]|nr:transposable element Tc3 transposase [Trichonephila clavipes]
MRKETEGSSASGGVCIFTSLDVPSSALPLRTSLQAVAVRIHYTSLITVCCLYLPPNSVIHQHNLNNLVGQLPAPFSILGDFNGHNTFDEAHFWLNGYDNKQNCRIWSEANPQVCVETPLHPETLTVSCALWAGGIMGPYFFKNDEGHNVTLNGDRYRAMITNFFIPELNNHDVQELWSNKKSLVYADTPQTPDHLEDKIRRVIPDIRPQMLENVIENWTSRLDYIRASRGCPMPEIIFKM